ncbi:MAG: hypothetical protein AB1758_20605 [Candidatus Eremiobacterota bacterium]
MFSLRLACLALVLTLLTLPIWAQSYPDRRVTSPSETPPPPASSPDTQTRSPAPQPSGGMSARQLVDSLYTPPSGLPVRDLILEVDCSDLVEKDGVGNLLPCGTDRIYYKYPNRLRVDTVFYDPGSQLDGKQAVIIRDGTNMWMFVSMGQYPVKKGADTQQPSLHIPFSLQKYPQDANNDYAVTGSETLEGIPVKVVQIGSPQRPQQQTRVWIDPARRVPLQLVMKLPGDKATDPVQEKKVIYRDIKQLEDGRYFPTRLEIYVNQVLRQARVYRGVKVNAGLQDSLFEPMKGFMK